MTLTGLWYSFDWYKSGAVWLLSRPQAAALQTQPKVQRAAHAGKSADADVKPDIRPDSAPLALDRVWSAFQRAEGDRYKTVLLNLPAGAGTIVRVRSWAGGSTDGPRDEFRIDAVTGEITSSEIYADKTAGERMLMRILDIHRGGVFGWPGRLAFMLAAAAMPLFAVTGLLLYLTRRRHRRLARQAEMRLVPGE
jgi:sulfite reductase (NADPH) flavoprotein alpha-component